MPAFYTDLPARTTFRPSPERCCFLARLRGGGWPVYGVETMSVRVVEAVSEAERELGRSLRYEVFVVEQAVPPEVEVDGLDDECRHFLAQVRQTGADASSVGATLIGYILTQAPAGVLVYVHAQESALGFWQRMGFVAEGPAFVEGGIPHRVMVWAQS
jgi:predicted GNAT family N-acyltransferase